MAIMGGLVCGDEPAKLRLSRLEQDVVDRSKVSHVVVDLHQPRA